MQAKIILYTTHCPKCRVLELKLKSKGVEFNTCDDVEVMKQLGIMSAPQMSVLQDDGSKKILSFYEAIQYVNSL